MDAIPETVQTQDPTPVVSKLKNSVGSIYLIISLALVAFILGGAVVYAYTVFTTPKVKSKAETPAQNETVLNDRTIQAPLSLNLPEISSSAVRYTFKTTVSQIKTEAGKLKEVLTPLQDQDNPDIPSFIVNPKTLYFTTNGTKTTQTKSSAVKYGQQVYVSMQQDIKTRKWSTSRITIIEKTKTASPSAKTSTSSASQKN